MQARIFVTDGALRTANAIKDLDYFDRMLLSDDEVTDISNNEGYFLKNGNKLNLVAIPASANVALRLVPEEPAIYHCHVTMPTNLRGCIFENAPHLPVGYGEIVTYWSGIPVNTNTGGAVYFQNPLNEYMVDLTPMDATCAGDDVAAAPVAMDNLLSEGVVVCITGLKGLISDLSMHDFFEIKIPVSQEMLGIDPDDFRSGKAYPASPSPQHERIFIQVADILSSPDQDRIFIDLLRHDLIDYGYWY